jgi:hypothetical protein
MHKKMIYKKSKAKINEQQLYFGFEFSLADITARSKFGFEIFLSNVLMQT